MRNKTVSNKSMWAELIQDKIKMNDVLTMYVARVDKRIGRIACPLHTGKDNNFSFNENLFQCFSCGAKGNVVSFVAQLFGISNKEAMIKIDNDFGLKIIGTNQTLLSKRKSRSIRDVANRHKVELEALKQQYRDLADVFAYLNRALIVNAPKDENEDTWHPVFIYAAQHISVMEYVLDELMEEIDARQN